MSNLNDIDLSQVEESKDFGAVKTTTTRLRIKEITKEAAKPGKEYSHYFRVLTEFVDPSIVEAVDPATAVSAPIVNLYVHNPGSLSVLRRFIEAHGYKWADFVGSVNREEFLQSMVGAEATAKITLQTKNTQTGEDLDSPRNEVKYKKAA